MKRLILLLPPILLASCAPVSVPAMDTPLSALRLKGDADAEGHNILNLPTDDFAASNGLATASALASEAASRQSADRDEASARQSADRAEASARQSADDALAASVAAAAQASTNYSRAFAFAVSSSATNYSNSVAASTYAFATNYTDAAILAAQLDGVDLSGYATTGQVAAAIADIDFSDYATLEMVAAAVAASPVTSVNGATGDVVIVESDPVWLSDRPDYATFAMVTNAVASSSSLRANFTSWRCEVNGDDAYFYIGVPFYASSDPPQWVFDMSFSPDFGITWYDGQVFTGETDPSADSLYATYYNPSFGTITITASRAAQPGYVLGPPSGPNADKPLAPWADFSSATNDLWSALSPAGSAAAELAAIRAAADEITLPEDPTAAEIAVAFRDLLYVIKNPIEARATLRATRAAPTPETSR